MQFSLAGACPFVSGMDGNSDSYSCGYDSTSHGTGDTPGKNINVQRRGWMEQHLTSNEMRVFSTATLALEALEA